MRVIIVGAGVVGAATAYFAAKQGHEVTLIDRNPYPAGDASYANAGQLSYSYTDTLADPGLLRRLPGMLLGRDPGMRISLDLSLLPWGMRFLRYCTRRQADRNTARLLDLASESALSLEELLRDVAIDFHHARAGKLVLTSSPQKLDGLRRRAALKRANGVEVDIVDGNEARSIEPALAGWRDTIAGAAFARKDSVGDARAFTQGLCNYLESAGCIFLRDTLVRGLIRHGRRIIGVDTPRGPINADAVVLCTGVGTRKLLRGTGLYVPIYPLKGYSVTHAPGPNPPRVSLTYLDGRIVFANIGGPMRLAGLADCVGYDASVDPQRIADLVRAGRAVMPDAMQFESSQQAWAGLRPATPSGLPIIGRTRLPGLFLNVGHGALGWTLACGSARQLATQLA